VKAKTNINKLAIRFTHRSICIHSYAGRVVINQVAPNIHNVLNIFEPTTAPTAISVCFLRAAITLTANSGSEVPIATMVTQINASGKPKFEAIETALSTINFHPPIKPIKPNTIYIVAFIFHISSISSSS
jgi:hypothetical protein